MNTTLLLNDSGPLERYRAGSIHFAGSNSALYERHLLFEDVTQDAYTRKEKTWIGSAARAPRIPECRTFLTSRRRCRGVRRSQWTGTGDAQSR
jgi:hypothetical protein